MFLLNRSGATLWSLSLCCARSSREERVTRRRAAAVCPTTRIDRRTRESLVAPPSTKDLSRRAFGAKSRRFYFLAFDEFQESSLIASCFAKPMLDCFKHSNTLGFAGISIAFVGTAVRFEGCFGVLADRVYRYNLPVKSICVSLVIYFRKSQ